MKIFEKTLAFIFCIVVACSQPGLAFVKNRGTELVQSYRQNPNNEAKTAEEYFFRALVKQMLGNPQEALADYKAVLELEPNDQDTYANRCGLLSDLGQYEAAIADCTQAIKQGGLRAKAIYFNLGIAQQGAGNLKAAINSFNTAAQHAKAIADDSLAEQAEQRINLAQRTIKGEITGGALASYWQASDQASKGEFEQALNLYDNALSSSPKFADAYLEKANLYAMQKKYPEALNSYQKAQKLNPELIPVYNNRAAVLIEYNKDYDGALKDLKTAANKASQRGDTEAAKFLQQSMEKVNELKKSNEK
jgi:tetratricopeptide (TPR) repeat protein